MDYFDSIVKKTKETFSELSNEGKEVSGEILDMVKNFDGIDGLKKKFEELGLKETVESWISKGQNIPITTEELSKILGADKIKEFAQKTGLSVEDATKKITESLPKLVDNFTPDGKVTEEISSFFSTNYEKLKSKLFN